MNEEWKTRPVGALCMVIAGQSPEGTFYNESGKGLPFYQGKKEFGEKYINKPQVWTTKTTKAALAGDILMSVRAPVGPINFATEKICIGRGLAAIRAGDELERDFLFYALLSKQSEIKGNDGAVFASINKEQIEAIEIPRPPLDEQQRIVAILDEAFAGIDKAIANTERNLANAKELFESYLNSVFANPGEDWEETTIGDCITFIDYRGKTPEKTSAGLRLITAKNVRMGYLKSEPEEFVSPSIYAKWMTRGIPNKGDVLFTTEAPLANVAQLDTDEKVVFAQRVIIMQTDENVLRRSFLKFLLISDPSQQRIHELATGATAQGIKASLLKTVTIQFPKNIKKQDELVSAITNMEAMTSELAKRFLKKIQDLQGLKQSILQKAFTGELTAKGGAALAAGAERSRSEVGA